MDDLITRNIYLQYIYDVICFIDQHGKRGGQHHSFSLNPKKLKRYYLILKPTELFYVTLVFFCIQPYKIKQENLT